MNRTTAKWSAPLTLVLLVAPACGEQAGDAAGEGRPGASAATPVEVAVARTDTVVAALRAVGSMEAEAQITVKAESPGRVVGIRAREGTRVEDGQILLVLDTAKLTAEMEVAEAAVARAETESRNLRRRLERNRQLLEEGAISPQTFDDIEAQTETAEAVLRESRARLELARERLGDATVEAPFAGQVGERTVDVGDYLAVGDPLFVLVDDQPLEIEFPVPERYVGRVRGGAPVDLRVRSLPGRTFVGHVVFVSPVVDTETRTVTVKARVPNTGSELRAGQFGEVRLELGLRPDAVVIPEAAIVPGRTESAVYVVEGDTARRRVVTLGTRTVGRIEVVSGVEAGDTVVVAGQQRLSDGVPVRVSDFSVAAGGTDTAAVGDTAARGGRGSGGEAGGGD